MQSSSQKFRTIEWNDGVVILLDQTKLPAKENYLQISDVDGLVRAIKRLSVRGAPAIGVAGAYGVALAARQFPPAKKPKEFAAAIEQIRTARPTAVNLEKRVTETMAAINRSSDSPADAALRAAHAIREEELQSSTEMGERGAYAVLDLCGGGPITAMTICNTGGLATVERGTALAVIQTLHELGHLAEAIPLETRPLLQGGRLTTWELQRMGANYRLIVDSAGPFLLSRGAADVVLIGADRIAANGDTANKIGSYSLALGAREAGVPFIVVAPESTVDFETATGAEIKIEDRGPLEVTSIQGHEIATAGSTAINPAFDVTPARLITAIVTEARVVRLDRGETLDPVDSLRREEIE
ncbi:MAG: S-methyl-5-thioribose-1-phosphate isomerase [Acidimicrobiales bacterium]|nr:S-methyl-5-thioribose-1-phosphate isomerase [Acidimicrobiales bacterium]